MESPERSPKLATWVAGLLAVVIAALAAGHARAADAPAPAAAAYRPTSLKPARDTPRTALDPAKEQPS